MKKIALIDLGSSTVKLNIYNLSELKLLNNYSETVNMAENFHPKKIIIPQAIDRVTDALIKYKIRCEDENIEQIILVTTGVAREAKNLEELSNEIKKASGWDLQVIPPEKEAKVFYKGVAADFEDGRKLAAINIGGGSTEITLGINNKIYKFFSFPMGVTLLNENFLVNDPPTAENIADMREYISKYIDLSDAHEFAPHLLIHTGGELTYMEKTNHPLKPSDFSPSHPKQIDLDAFEEKFKEISVKTKEELQAYMPENPKWMNGAISCSALAIEIAKDLEVNVIVPSNKNLNDGLLLEYATKV